MNLTKILAIKVRALGDTIIMTPALAELKRIFPAAQIDVLVDSNWASVLEHHPAISRIWTFNRGAPKTKRAVNLLNLAMRLGKQHYDAVLNFHASSSSALLARATRAKIRAIHFHGHNDQNRYSTVEIPGKGVLKPCIERDLDVVRALGVNVSSNVLPRVCPTPHETARAASTLRKQGVRWPLLALGLSASRPAKMWPADYFAKLAVKWCIESGGGVIGLAGPGEEEKCAEFLKLTGASNLAISAVSNVPIRAVAAMLNCCSVYLGADSGLKHLAVSVGTPTCSIFGPEDPFEWHPYSQDLHPRLFVEGLPCRKEVFAGMPPWCSARACPEGHHRCMREISVEQALNQCIRIAKR